MCRWIETIALSEGNLINMDYHFKRIRQTLDSDAVSVIVAIKERLKLLSYPSKGYYKLRLLYDRKSLVEFDIVPYRIRTIDTFELVEAPHLDYSEKYEDRCCFEELKKESLFDELIITQKGKITDTTYSNLLFEKEGEWFTPEQYLLKGTYREFLLDKEIIKEAKITQSNLASFNQFKLINAMLSIENSPSYHLDQIHYSKRSFVE